MNSEAAQPVGSELRILVLEGEGSVNIIEQGTAIPALIEVRDRNDLPVSGASILFLLGDGASSTLNAGLQQVATTTNALGQAGVTINPIATGGVELTVSAAFEGQTATATIAQTNFASAPAASSAGSEAATSTAGSGAGGGLGAGTITAIAGAAAGAAVGVGIASTGDDGTTSGTGDRTPNDDDDDTQDDQDDGTVDDNGDSAGENDTAPTTSAPNAPDTPALRAAARELEASWTDPADNGSPIDDYDVRYRGPENVWTELPDETKNTARSARIRGLTNGTTYEVQVRAGNAAGDGPWSRSAEGTPKAADTGGLERDRAALIALYDATDGDNWTNNTNWKSDKPVDEWYGVNIEGVLRGETRVRELWLAENGLRGHIPRETGDLTELEVFDLGQNELTGTIPASLGNLKAIIFELWMNYLTGPIPASLCHRAWMGINPQRREGSTTLVELPCETTTTELQNGAELRVADARAHEEAGARIAFEVSLSKPAATEVTVDYATIDGSAHAGEDYVGTTGTARLAAGETATVIEVEILDDDHDEGVETFELGLSSPRGAVLTVGAATGTIDNTDPLPSALIARFGRASAEHVMEQVADRMAQPRGVRGRRSKLAGDQRGPASQYHARNALAGWGPPETGPGGNHRTSSGVDLLTGEGFELNQPRNDAVIAIWSRSTRSTFGGREGPLTLNGDVRTTMVGADYSRGRLTAGVALARSHGTGGYAGNSRGQVEATATGLYPWVGYRVTDRVSVWGMTGYGTGALRLSPEQGAGTGTGLTTAMTAAGTRGEILKGRGSSGLRLAFKADALWVGTSIDRAERATGNLAVARATVTRVRSAIEASRQLSIRRRVVLTPSMEIGFRQDGGDAETGTGMDVGGGLELTDQATGLSATVRARTLVAHQAEGFTDRGISVSIGWNPTPASPLGLTARMTPSWGQEHENALWSADGLPRLGAREQQATGRMDAEIGYGVPIGSSLVGTPRIGWSTSPYGRAYRLGYNIRALETGARSVDLGIETERRRDTATGQAGTGVIGRASIRW